MPRLKASSFAAIIAFSDVRLKTTMLPLSLAQEPNNQRPRTKE